MAMRSEINSNCGMVSGRESNLYADSGRPV